MNTDTKINLGPCSNEVEIRQIMQGLGDGVAALLQVIILNLASKDADANGESVWLNLALGHISKDGLSDVGKIFAMGIIASVEHTLREIAQMEKAEGSRG
jgi:hypothetical protein